jgi:ferredoxin
MSRQDSFRDYCLVACAILHPELSRLQDEGFLDAKKVFYIPAGLHIKTDRLEERLTAQLQKALEICPADKIIVVQGARCFVSPDDPYRRIDDIIREQAPGIKRVQAAYGYDMLAGKEERNEIAAGGDEGRVLWFTPGWLKNWKTIYQRYVGWDKADANANFPGYYDEIVVLDGLEVAETYQTERVEEILEIFDWTGLQVRCHPISLDRLKGLLLDTLSHDE